MIHKNLTPFHFGPKVTSRNPPQPEMMLVVRGTFTFDPLDPHHPLEPIADPLEQGFMTGDMCADDDIERTGELLYASDFADFKPKTDILLNATCHPRERPATVCPVRVQIGEWSKTLVVHGDRQWMPGLLGRRISEPLPFESMPIRWSRAFGGPEFKWNPAGTGFRTDRLPNIEDPQHPVRTPTDSVVPAGFGPINPEWPQRQQKRGKKYGSDYRKRRAPYYAEDFDWTFFNAAPDDQQLPDYLRGDESVVFQNLHPTVADLVVKLPALRIRAIVKFKTGDYGEAPMHLDTLYADLDAGKIFLTWRGLHDVQTDDMADVSVVLIVSEPLDSEPRPNAEYHAIIDKYEDDPVGIKDQMPPGFVEQAEQLEAMEMAELRGEVVQGDVERALAKAAAGEEDAISAFVSERMGGAMPDVQAQLKDALARAKAAYEAGSPAPSFDQLAAQAISNTPGPMHVPSVVQSMAAPPPHIKLGPHLQKLAAARNNLAAAGIDSPAFAVIDEKLAAPELAQIDPGFSAPPGVEVADKMPEGSDFLNDMTDPATAAKADAADADGQGTADATEASPGAGAAAASTRPTGADYANRDLTGHDFSNQDLAHANFTGAILTKTNFSGADCSGTVFDQAVIDKANLRGANFTGASFRGAQIDLCNADEANFSECDFEFVNLTRSLAPKALMRRARGEFARFTRTDFSDLDAEGAELPRSDWEASTLSRANFRHARLVQASFRETKSHGANFNEADVTNFAGCRNADFTGATFVAATANDAVFQTATLTRTDFSFAELRDTHFHDCVANAANFLAADMKRSRLRKAILDAATFVQANLFEADLCKTSLVAVRFTSANLYNAKMLGATVANCDFTQANVTMLMMDER